MTRRNSRSPSDAYQITKDPEFAEVAREVLEYVLRDMRGTEGGFYSAQMRTAGLRKAAPNRRKAPSMSGASIRFVKSWGRSSQRFSSSTMGSFRPAMCPPSRILAVS